MGSDDDAREAGRPTADRLGATRRKVRAILALDFAMVALVIAFLALSYRDTWWEFGDAWFYFGIGGFSIALYGMLPILFDTRREVVRKLQLAVSAAHLMLGSMFLTPELALVAAFPHAWVLAGAALIMNLVLLGLASSADVIATFDRREDVREGRDLADEFR